MQKLNIYTIVEVYYTEYQDSCVSKYYSKKVLKKLNKKLFVKCLF